MKKVLSIILTVVLIATMFIGCGKSSGKTPTLSGYLSKGQRIFLLVDCDDYVIPAKDSDVKTVFIFNEDGTFINCSPDMTLGELEQMEDSEIIELAKQEYEEIIKENTDGVYDKLKDAAVLNSKEEWLSKTESFFYINKTGGFLGRDTVDYSWADDYNPATGEKPFDKSDDGVFAFENSLKDYNGELGIMFKDIVKKNVLECYSTMDYNKTADNIYNELNECFEASEASQTAKKGLDDFINNPAGQYKIVINSDSTGNSAISETLVLQDEPIMRDNFSYVRYTSNINLQEINLYGNFADVDLNGFEIYDSTYLGYAVTDEDTTFSGYYLLTRGKNLEKFTLDPIGTKNTTTDNIDEVLKENKKVIFDITSYIKGEKDEQ